MTSRPAALKRAAPLRRNSVKFWLAATMGIALLGACATGPTRPTTPVYTGNERPEPSRPDRPDAPEPRDPDAPIDLADLNPIGPDDYVPPQISEDADPDTLVRVAVLLPFTSPNAAVRREAEGLLDAVEMALFDSGSQTAVLMQKDTGGDPLTTQAATEAALAEGADVILGPLFAANVRAAADIAREEGVPVISFSTDATVAGEGAYLMSITPEEEVARIVDWASLQGVDHFALFGPRNTYGARVQAALEFEVERRGGVVFGVQSYEPQDPSPVLQAQTLAAEVNALAENAPGRIAVLIPERGVRLRSVAPLMPYYDVDLSAVKLLGTGLWNDAEVWREPSLFGGAFAAPDPAAQAGFQQTFVGNFGADAPQLASLGYDAAALAIALGEANALIPETMERGDGFVGVNGLFRFAPEGVSEHGLAVFEVREVDGAVVIDRARTSFDADGA